jgi:DnaA-homolog protein
MRQLAFSLVPAAPTLDNFLVGSNGELLSALRSAVDAAGGERFVYLWGQRGCGKSHLLAGVSVAAHRPLRFAASEAELCAIDPEADADLVLVDDVQDLGAVGQAHAFRLYNVLRERGGGLVAAGDRPPSRLALRDDLVTRLGWGLVYQVHALSDAEKAAALEAHARDRGFELPRDVVDYLLSRQSRDLTHLVSLLDGLDRYSLETKRPVTVPLARELLLAIAAGR